MARFEKFLPKLMLQLLDCPEPVALDAIRSACIKFCTDTFWWSYEPEPMPIVEGATTYPLDTPAGTVPVAILDAWVNGQRLAPTSEEAISAKAPDWRDTEGTPTSYLQFTPDEIVVAPTPTDRIEDGLKMLIAIRPSQTGFDVDDSVLEYHYETIIAGALAELYGHAGRPYSNPSAIGVKAVAFRDGISDAKAARQRGFTRGPMRVQMRSWT